jgi:S-methylmethionine-dependent homocysteine/selenocysteine methylase
MMTIEERLAGGELVIIDGAMGTELERRGVPMDELAWSGAAVIDYPEIVVAAHRDYIDAGAEAIITNTFGMSPFMLAATRYADRAEEGLRQAVRLAHRARDEAGRPDVAVVGSISTMAAGGDIGRPHKPITSDEACAGFELMMRVFEEEGADAVALEMMEDVERAPLAMAAAKHSKLPVWLGVSCARAKEGDGLVAFDFPATTFADILDCLLPMGPDVVNVMHSDVNVTPDAIDMVKARWSGPLGVYPESGYFTMPNWHFVDIISPGDLVAEAKKWVAQGVRLIGGCCGLGPEHTRALSAARAELMP